MRAFKVSGSFTKNRGKSQSFRIEVAAEDEDAAVSKVLSTLGSRHRLNRRDISIEGIEGVSEEEITNQAVRYRVEGRR